MAAVTRAFGYVRLSRETEASTSPERQRQDITRLVESRGWELVDVVEDLDVSATRNRLDRPGLHKLRKRIAAGEADVVVVSRLDRLARSVIDISTLLDDGLLIVSANEAFDASSATGRAMIQVAQVFAEMEARTIGSRVRSMRNHLPTVGRWPGGPPPYGFATAPHPDGAGRTLVHHPEEVEVVRRMVREVLAGTSVGQVVIGLNADGVPPRRGVAWTRGVAVRVLRHRSLRGYATLAGDAVRDERGLPVVTWPPILSDEDARALAQVMEKRTAYPRRPAGERVPLLHRVAYCSSCERPLTPRHFSHPTRAALYTCQTRGLGRACARPQTVTASRAEEAAEKLFLAAWGDVEVIETVRETVQPEGLADVLTAIAQTQEAIGRPGANVMSLAQRMVALGAERDRLSALPRTVATHRRTGRTYRQLWEGASTTERREIMLGAQAYVWVHPAKARGHWDDDRVTLVDELAGSVD